MSNSQTYSSSSVITPANSAAEPTTNLEPEKKRNLRRLRRFSRNLFSSRRRASEPMTTCPVCLEIVTNSMSVEPCGHVFCATCILRWMTQNTSCPTCRAELKLNLRSWKGRRSTFANWKSKQDPDEMADAGFFYQGHSDLVECIYCGIMLDQWLPYDNPFLEHLRLAPKCPRFIFYNYHERQPITSQPQQNDFLGQNLIRISYSLENNHNQTFVDRPFQRLFSEDMWESNEYQSSDDEL